MVLWAYLILIHIPTLSLLPSPFSLLPSTFRRIFVATRKYILHGVWAWYLCEQWLLRWTSVHYLCPWEVFEFKVPFSFRPLPSTSLPSPPLPFPHLILSFTYFSPPFQRQCRMLLLRPWERLLFWCFFVHPLLPW